MQNIKLIVGLGNPGFAYKGTRHNLGFLVVAQCAKKWGVSFKKERRFQAEMALFEKGFLLKPETYMNLSGHAVQKVASFYKVDLSDLMVVTDDVDLPFGKLRMRGSGSSGGHKGLLSIEESLGTRAFARLRIGVGRDETKELEKFVLERFSKSEKEELPRIEKKAVEAIETWLESGLGAAMRKTNSGEE